jgi:hypothetical protein
MRTVLCAAKRGYRREIEIMPTQERRTGKRRYFDHFAIIDSGDGVPLSCQILDISKTGARLLSDGQVGPVSSFLLYFTKDRQVFRRCDVVWRKGCEFGVKFNVVADLRS